MVVKWDYWHIVWSTKEYGLSHLEYQKGVYFKQKLYIYSHMNNIYKASLYVYGG